MSSTLPTSPVFLDNGTTWTVYGYRAVPYEIPRGCVTGYTLELNDFAREI